MNVCTQSQFGNDKQLIIHITETVVDQLWLENLSKKRPTPPQYNEPKDPQAELPKIMEHCWEANPGSRPTLAYIKGRFHKFMSSL